MIKITQQQKEFAYSLVLIILIPACMIGATLWLTLQVKNDYDQELRQKANLANEVFNVSVGQALAGTTTTQAAKAIQAQINQTMVAATDIDELDVSVPAGAGFLDIASSDPAKAGHIDTAIQTTVAASNMTAVASLVAAGEAGNSDWLVATPVLGNSGKLLGVTSMRVSLTSADATISTTLRNSLIMVGVMVAAIMLLLINHFRFVQYAELFRKQKELDQMKDDFISIATHELKAPMTVIKGYLSMTLESKLPKEPHDMVKIAFDQTDRLGRLVTDLLDVSRIEQGRTKYNLTRVDLPATIGPMMGTFEVKARDKQLKLHYNPPADVPAVTADPDRVSEVFTNLIDNAIKYSVNGQVTVEHVATPTHVNTKVSDSGIGMTADEQGRLFERFYRARNDDTKNIPGTGLGLWIVKQYIEHMGGTIQVQSEKGHGTTFTVALPRFDPASPETD